MPAEAACVERILDYIFQLTARNVECSEPLDPIKTGPKVDEIISNRVFRAQKHGWHGLVEEYHADAALRRNTARTRQGPTRTDQAHSWGAGVTAGRRRLLPQCKNDAAYVCRILLDSSSHFA